MSTLVVLNAIAAERDAQIAKWGEQNHLDGTGPSMSVLDDGGLWAALDNASHREFARRHCDRMHEAGCGTWEHILTEEYAEAIAESDPRKLRTELIQLAAVATAWVEHIDRRIA